MTPPRRWTRRPPDCRRVAHVLHAYLDGELAEDDAMMVVAHLQECRRCGIDARVYQHVKRMLRGLAVAPDPIALARLREYSEHLGDRRGP